MQNTSKHSTLFGVLFIFMGLPTLFWFLGEYPFRSFLKDSLGLATLLALYLLYLQFFLSGIPKTPLESYRFKTIIRIHKYIGYVVVLFFMLHPFFIVLPRFFEAGLLPQDALIKLLTTFETQGEIVGLIAYLLIFFLGATSLFRHKLGMKYRSWKLLHGITSLLFIFLASWHAIDMGRHINDAQTLWIVLVASTASWMLLQSYRREDERIK